MSTLDRSVAPGRAGRLAGAAALAATAVLAAACGSGPGLGAGGRGPATASLPLATSAGGAGLPGWGVVEMGGTSSSDNNFWELFTRPAGSPAWKLATPLGVASNGGLSIASTRAGLVAGFLPSQDLTFSPLATAASPGAAWSQASAPVSPGLARAPDALAASPAGQVLALTRSGTVLLGRRQGAAWTTLTTLRSIAHTAAGRACGLTALTAVAFTAAGTPVIGGACTRLGPAGIFLDQHGSLVAADLPLPGGPATVLALAGQAAGHTGALLELGSGQSATIVTGTLPASAASTGTVSAAVPAGGRTPRSLALWSDGGAGLVLADGRALASTGPGAAWRRLPPLPPGVATLALGPAGQLQALAAAGDLFTVWQLAAAGTSWDQVQQIKVTIPYGSSS